MCDSKETVGKTKFEQNTFSYTASQSTGVLNLWNHQLASPKQSNYVALLSLALSFKASNTPMEDKIMGHTVHFNKLPLT